VSREQASFSIICSSSARFRSLGDAVPDSFRVGTRRQNHVWPATFNFVEYPARSGAAPVTGIGRSSPGAGLVAESRGSRRAVTSGVFMLLILLVAACGIWARCSRSVSARLCSDSHSGIRARRRARHRQYGEPIAFAVVQLLTRNRRATAATSSTSRSCCSLSRRGMAFQTRRRRTSGR